jgi:hypothetical protein
MSSNPLPRRGVLAAFVTAACMAAMPAALHAEPAPQASAQAQAVTGTLSVRFADEFAQKRSELQYYLKDHASGQVYRLQMPRNPKAVGTSGREVTLRGTPNGRSLQLDETAVQSLETQLSTQAIGTGTTDATQLAATTMRKTLVMTASFNDAAAECSTASVQNLMFTDPNNLSVDDLYQWMSQGRIGFTGAVAGPYAMNEAGAGLCNYDGWAAKLDAAAKAAGIDPAQYTHRVYVLPSSTSCAAGLGDLGGSAPQAWVKHCNLPDVYAHELGHNLGMHHASTPTSEYDDTSDVMGYSGIGLRGVNAAHSDQMGWRASTQVRTVTTSGFYDVAPLQLAAGTALAPQVLKIPKPGSTEYYYVSYRQPSSFDANMSSGYHTVNVHRYAGGMTRTYALAALGAGQSYVDSTTGVSIALITRTDGYATVDVQVPSSLGCTASAPTVSVTPATQSVAPGSAPALTLQVTNRDGSGCAARSLQVGATLPVGWTGTVSPASLTVSPGQTASSTITVNVPAGAPAGSYSVTGRVTDAATSQAVGTASATLSIAGADTVAPSVPVGLAATANSKQLRIALSWQAASDNVGVAGYRVWRNGVAVAQTAGTTYTDASISSGVTYSYAVSAYDAAGNASAASAPVAATVTANANGSANGGRKK